MGRILTIASSKGGNGKTATCCLLAPGLVVRGYRVGVIDSDPNMSFSEWHRTYSGPPIRCQAEARDVQLVDLAQAWADEIDVVIVDTAGFSNLSAAAAMGCADYVLVPCMADRGSTREAAKTVQKVASLARAARRAIPASVVLNQWRAGGQAEAAALDDLADYGVTGILRTPIPERAAFRKMSFDGRAITTGVLGLMVDRLIDELEQLAGLEGTYRSMPSLERTPVNRASGAELVAQIRSETEEMPPTRREPVPVATPTATEQINFRASPELARILARLAVEQGSIRLVIARLLRDAGYSVPEADLAPPPGRRRL